MAGVQTKVVEHMAERRKTRKAPRFAPAGQSTQMVVGATDTPDADVIATAARLYRRHELRRVYYSAFSPIPNAPRVLPSRPPVLVREHRLYQADWLIRFYGFEEHEIVAPNGMLSLEHDPKLAWALAHPGFFPVDLNRAPREQLLRVPGLGVLSVKKLLASRRVRTLRLTDLPKLHISVSKVMQFVLLPDHRPSAPVAFSGASAVRTKLPPQSSPASIPSEQFSLAWG